MGRRPPGEVGWGLVCPLAPAGLEKEPTPEGKLELELIATIRGGERYVAGTAVSHLMGLDTRSERFIRFLNELSMAGIPKHSALALGWRARNGDKQALQIASERLAKKDADAGFYAYALIQTKDAKYIPDLIKAFDSPDVELRQTAIEGLYSLVSKGAEEVLTPFFRAALSDPDPRVQYRAMFGLGKLRYGDKLGGGWPNRKPLPAYDIFMADPKKYVEEWKKEQ